ncbi:Mitogen-activated protein kinase 15, variant 2 [Schistosoma haematobium]|uniref:Mitogen-activated protein kinase 15, variant 2 n=1 Tax=Schistosoma haematobium TaxID=6185 RepID=A0A922LEQ0_SCHHA|nr:Mitogen-activated protein kinase 15, variant 2 [Schistosoma haematobium]KAH9580305.1 Mitogen-activated protein kinase 15, variant 2 [Schistosoma haematobium]
MNNSLVEMKKPESFLDKSDQQFENPFGKTLISINNRLNHLLKTNYPSSSTVITSSLTSSSSLSSSSDWPKCQSPTPIKSKSSSSSTTTTTMSSSHKWLNANDNIEQNKSKFVTMNKSHKYNFSKSTNNLLNHSNTLNNSSSLSSGQLTPCQIQTTTNLNEERNYKSISENKINELDMQNRRFASAPLLPAPLLTGNIIRNRPVINITSTTTTTTTTKSTGDIFSSTKLNSKSYLISSNTGSSSVVRLHSSSELNNLFQDYRLRRTSKSTSIDESISPGCVSSNDIHTNNQRHTNINNHHTTSLAQFYHPSHLRNDSMQPNLNGIHDQHSDLRKSSVKYMSTASNILDTATEASKNSKIQLSTSDSQVNHVIRTKFLSNGISNNTSNHQKSYRTLLPSANLGLQFNTISDRTKCSHLKQSHININSTLNDTNKLNHETLPTNTKYTPLINHNRQRLIPQHVLSRLKSLKEMNNSENHYM